MNSARLSPPALLLAVIACVGCSREERVVPEVPIVPIKDNPSSVEDGEIPAGGPVIAGPLTETEPNSSRTTATPLPVNGTLTGAIAVADSNDVDWFVLSLEDASQQVRVQLSPGSEDDVVLEWMPTVPTPKKRGRRSRKKRRDPDPPLARMDIGGPGAVEVLPAVNVLPGQHYFRVSRAKRSRRNRRRPPKQRAQRDAPYRLVTTVIDAEPVLELEPNGSRDYAGELQPGETRTGHLGWYGDQDWYRLPLGEASEGSLVRIDLRSPNGVKSRLWVTDRQGKSLVKTPESGVPWPIGNPVTIRDVAVIRKRLPYYVQVTTMKGANTMQQYELTARVDMPQSPHEAEPNWSPALSSLLETDTPINGYIGHPTDWDTFRLESRSPVMATIVTTGVPNVDLKLELIDQRKTVIRTIDDGPQGSPETLGLVPVGPDTAYVRVSSKKHTFNIDAGYRIAVTTTEIGNQELEPNDDLTQGRRTPLREGVDFEGYVHPRGDIDVFAFDITAPEGDAVEKTMSIYLRGVVGLNLGMELLDAKGELITRKRGIGPQTERNITHSFTPGRYYVRIKELTSSASNTEEPYLIRLGAPPQND
ncbi:MAG: hypothetical protein VX223_12050 [Myxococcota bacterium]|nr:hypothetical protein [Myxococcota bacterium]